MTLMGIIEIYLEIGKTLRLAHGKVQFLITCLHHSGSSRRRGRSSRSLSRRRS